MAREPLLPRTLGQGLRPDTREIAGNLQTLRPQSQEGRCSHERRLIRSMTANSANLLGWRRAATRRLPPMKGFIRIAVALKIDVAACLLGIAAIIHALR